MATVSGILIAKRLDTVWMLHIFGLSRMILHDYVTVELGIGTQSGDGSESRAHIS